MEVFGGAWCHIDERVQQRRVTPSLRTRLLGDRLPRTRLMRSIYCNNTILHLRVCAYALRFNVLWRQISVKGAAACLATPVAIRSSLLASRCNISRTELASTTTCPHKGDVSTSSRAKWFNYPIGKKNPKTKTVICRFAIGYVLIKRKKQIRTQHCVKDAYRGILFGACCYFQSFQSWAETPALLVRMGRRGGGGGGAALMD